MTGKWSFEGGAPRSQKTSLLGSDKIKLKLHRRALYLVRKKRADRQRLIDTKRNWLESRRQEAQIIRTNAVTDMELSSSAAWTNDQESFRGEMWRVEAGRRAPLKHGDTSSHAPPTTTLMFT